MMSKVAYVCLSVCFLTGACDGEKIEKVGTTGSLQNALGIVFFAPEERTFTVSGQMIELEHKAVLRTTNYIQIFVDTDAPATTDELVEKGVNPAPYTVHSGGGGSGGPEYTLRTEKNVGGREIDFVAVVQTELGQPSFGEAWAVWESVSASE